MARWRVCVVILALGAVLCASSPHRRRRDAVSPTFIVRFSFSRYNDAFPSDPFCAQGLDRPGNITLQVSYRTGAMTVGGSLCSTEKWQHHSTISTDGSLSSHTVSLPLGANGTQLRILQLDHAGVNCSNWQLSNVSILSQVGVETPLSLSRFLCSHSQTEGANGEGDVAFIDGSASMPRGLVSQWLLDSDRAPVAACDCGSVESLLPLQEPESPLLCSGADQQPHIKLSFLLHWSYDGSDDCDPVDTRNEGIELSIRRRGDLVWRPIAYFMSSNRTARNYYRILLGYWRDEELYLRGYRIPHLVINDSDVQHNMTFKICSPEYLQPGVQLRWLQTVAVIENEPRDVWSLDDVRVDVRHPGVCRATVLEDDFEDHSTISTLDWPAQRRAGLVADEGVCNDGRSGMAAWFSNHTASGLQSRLLATRPLDLTPCAILAAGLEPLSLELNSIYMKILLDPAAGLQSLLEHLDGRDVNETEVVFLLLEILQGIGNDTVDAQFSKDFLEVGSRLMDIVSSRGEESPSSLAGSTLLDVMDQFALTNHNSSNDSVSTANLELAVVAVEEEEKEDSVTVLEIDNYSISLPQSLFSGGRHVSSFLYRNMSGFLDNTLPGDERSNSTLVGPVLSSFLHCGLQQCDTSSSPLEKPVRLVFPNPMEDDVDLTCVFWIFGKRKENSFIPGSWDTSGCRTIVSNSTVTCECSHLTHFAILLSPGIEADDGVELSLQVIGIVGVSVSLVALILTIFTFTVFRSLWSMRNYIHIQLCVSLFIAQLVFIIAVEPRGSEAACSVVAVLLHYLFLVSFMWMLMEGVVLYVALVRVFIENHLRYIIAFTIAGYGIPLVYMALCVPLGFALKGSDGKPHYGSEAACWLRYDTHFVWAFITPVILIILINIGFFFMTTVIMCRHQRRQTHQSTTQKVRHWLKTSVSLMVVMGITWVIGVLVFTEALLFVAYIFTIFIAFQGLIIFILLIILSQQVRDTYRKWWKVRVANSEFLSRHFSEKETSKTQMTQFRSSTGSPSMDKSTADSERNGNTYSVPPNSKTNVSISQQTSEGAESHRGAEDAIL